MNTCTGCRWQQTVDQLCLSCTEDLSVWLRSIPDLFAELTHVRLPGSVRTPGPRTGSTGAVGSRPPVRLEVIDLADMGIVTQALASWCQTFGIVGRVTVAEQCYGLRSHVLAIANDEFAGDFYRRIKALCRELGRVVGEPQEQSVGKCARPIGDEVCRGPLFRAADGASVYCKRCGDKPEIQEQEVWVTLREAALVTGRPIETIRTWYKRGLLGWGPPVAPGMAWLPIVMRRCTTVPQSGTMNHGSGAEPSPGGAALGLTPSLIRSK